MPADSEVAVKLVRLGRQYFDSPPRGLADDTGVPEANRLLNDIHKHPHLFVLGCLAQVMVSAKKAWLMPYEMGNRLGGHSFDHMAAHSKTKILEAISRPEPLLPFFQNMGERVFLALKRIREEYVGDASRIWSGLPGSAEVVCRFLEFDGAGPKIACMATNLLFRDFGVRLADHSSIDVSVDVHVRRVFIRAGLVPKASSDELLIYKARAIHPEYPGVLDYPVWEIGSTWCRPKKPRCRKCRIGCCCPKVGVPE